VSTQTDGNIQLPTYWLSVAVECGQDPYKFKVCLLPLFPKLSDQGGVVQLSMFLAFSTTNYGHVTEYRPGGSRPCFTKLMQDPLGRLRKATKTTIDYRYRVVKKDRKIPPFTSSYGRQAERIIVYSLST
jgi:hypothetical protein